MQGELPTKLLGEGEIEAESVVSWTRGATEIEIIQVTPWLSLVSSRGPGHPDSVPFYAEESPKLCKRAGSVIFWDLGSLTSTNLAVVRTSMAVGKANRPNIAEVHMYYDSPLVGMAVTVGNVALNGLIRLYRSEPPFVEAFSEALQAAQGAARAGS